MQNLKPEFKLSYEDSRLLTQRAEATWSRINDIVERGVAETHRQAIKQLNKHVYDLAEKNGCSVYDICYSYMPDIGMPEIGYDSMPELMKVRQEIRLMPIKFEFSKGGGYWKGKYFQLKRKLQELIDSREV